MPPYMRTAFMGCCAFLWASFLCFSRQSGDGTAAVALAFVMDPRKTLEEMREARLARKKQRMQRSNWGQYEQINCHTRTPQLEKNTHRQKVRFSATGPPKTSWQSKQQLLEEDVVAHLDRHRAPLWHHVTLHVPFCLERPSWNSSCKQANRRRSEMCVMCSFHFWDECPVHLNWDAPAFRWRVFSGAKPALVHKHTTHKLNLQHFLWTKQNWHNQWCSEGYLIFQTALCIIHLSTLL